MRQANIVWFFTSLNRIELNQSNAFRNRLVLRYLSVNTVCQPDVFDAWMSYLYYISSSKKKNERKWLRITALILRKSPFDKKIKPTEKPIPIFSFVFMNCFSLPENARKLPKWFFIKSPITERQYCDASYYYCSFMHFGTWAQPTNESLLWCFFSSLVFHEKKMPKMDCNFFPLFIMPTHKLTPFHRQRFVMSVTVKVVVSLNEIMFHHHWTRVWFLCHWCVNSFHWVKCLGTRGKK